MEYFTWQDEENPSSPLFLPCCDWLSGVGSGGSGSCGCSELGWSGCWCLPSNRTAASDAVCLGPAECCQSSLQAFSGDLFMFTSQTHVKCCAASPCKGEKQCIPLEGRLCKRLGEEGGACGKGV